MYLIPHNTRSQIKEDFSAISKNHNTTLTLAAKT